MAQEKLIKLKSKATGEILYTTRNKKKFTNKNFKLKLSKFSKKAGKHVDFTESK